MILTKFMIEALHVVEGELVRECAERMTEVLSARPGDLAEAREWSWQAQDELEDFRKVLRSKSEVGIEFWLASFAGAIKASEFGQAFMARQTTPRRRLMQKAEHVSAVKLAAAREAMQGDIQRMDMTWANLDGLSKRILQQIN